MDQSVRHLKLVSGLLTTVQDINQQMLNVSVLIYSHLLYSNLFWTFSEKVTLWISRLGKSLCWKLQREYLPCEMNCHQYKNFSWLLILCRPSFIVMLKWRNAVLYSCFQEFKLPATYSEIFTVWICSKSLGK